MVREGVMAKLYAWLVLGVFLVDKRFFVDAVPGVDLLAKGGELNILALRDAEAPTGVNADLVSPNDR